MRLRMPRVERLLGRARRGSSPALAPPVVVPSTPESDLVDVEWRRFSVALALDETYSLPPHELARATVEDLEDHVERLRVEIERSEREVAKSGYVGPPASRLRRLKRELVATETGIDRIFGIAKPPLVAGGPVEEAFFCTYCGAKLHGGRHEAYQLGSMCPRCHEAAKGVKREPVNPPHLDIEAAIQTVLKRRGSERDE